MNCNIIRELHLNADSYTKLQTVDELHIYERGDLSGLRGTTESHYIYGNAITSKLVKLSNTETNIYKGVLNTGDAIRTLIKPGLSAAILLDCPIVSVLFIKVLIASPVLSTPL